MTSKHITVLIALLVVVAGVACVFINSAPSITASDMDAPRDPAPQGKLDMNVVCESALAYMSFPDGAAADFFVAECKKANTPRS